MLRLCNRTTSSQYQWKRNSFRRSNHGDDVQVQSKTIAGFCGDGGYARPWLPCWRLVFGGSFFSDSGSLARMTPLFPCSLQLPCCAFCSRYEPAMECLAAPRQTNRIYRYMCMEVQSRWGECRLVLRKRCTTIFLRFLNLGA